MFNKKYSNLFLFVLYLLFSVTISYFFVTRIYSIAIGLMGLSLLVTIFFCKNLFKKIKAKSLLKILFWLTIITSFTGTAFLTIPFGSYHLFLFRLFLPVILLLILLQILLNKGILIISCKKIKFYLLFLIIWFSYAVITLSWASSKADALRQIYFLFVGLSITFLIILYLKSLRDFKNFYLLWVAMTIGLLSIGLWEVLTGNHLLVSSYLGRATAYAGKFLPSTVFYNTNDFATFLGLTFPFILSWLHYKKKLKSKLLGLGLLGCSFYLLLATGSRANLLALILEIFIFLFFLLNWKKRIKWIIVASSFIIFLLIVSPLFIQQTLNQIETSLKSFTSTYQRTVGSDAMRINLIKNAVYYSYGFGVGAGNIEQHIANYSPYYVSTLLNLHNWWAEILANYGILIFIGYLLFYIHIIKNLWKIWHRKIKTTERMICETLLLSLIGFSIASVSSSSIMAFNPQWIIFGTSLAFLNYYKLKYNKNTV